MKNKLIGRVIAVIIIALIAMGLLFAREVRLEKQEYQKSVLAMLAGNILPLDQQEAYDLDSYGLNQLMDSDELEWRMLTHVSNNGMPLHPTVVGMYSKDGKLIKTSGSILNVYLPKEEKTYFLDMDNYLTDQKKLDYFSSYGENTSVDIFSYIRNENGEIIPVEISFCEWEVDEKGDRRKTNTFALDFKDTNGLTEKDYETYEVEATSIAAPYFIDDREGSKNNKIYQSIYALFKDEIEPGKMYPPGGPQDGVGSNSISTITTSKDYGGYYYTMAMSSLLNVSIDGNEVPVYVHYYTADNVMKSAWKSAAFRNEFAIITAITAILITYMVIKATDKQKRKVDLSKRTFISAAAHELKTPISVIQNQSELIMEGVHPDRTMDYVKSIYEESLRMDKLVKSIQQYDRLDEVARIELKTFNLAETAWTELRRYEKLMESREINLTEDIPEILEVEGDRELMALVIDNYLSNAVKYTEVNGKIKVSLSDRKGARFSVINTGEAIDESELDKIWDIFYKADKSRSRGESSSDTGGMGLALCKRILELHDFDYGCKNVDDGIEFWFAEK